MWTCLSQMHSGNTENGPYVKHCSFQLLTSTDQTLFFVAHNKQYTEGNMTFSVANLGY